MLVMQGFGGRLHQAMTLAGADVSAISKRCGIDRTTVDKWLHDHREISTVHAKNLYCVADFLKVSARWLATGKGEARPERAGLSFTASKIGQTVDELPPEQQLIVEALLNQLKRN